MPERRDGLLDMARHFERLASELETRSRPWFVGCGNSTDGRWLAVAANPKLVTAPCCLTRGVMPPDRLGTPAAELRKRRVFVIS